MYMWHGVQVVGEPQWHLETQDAQTGAVMLSTAQVSAKPGGRRQLLEEVCLEGAKLTSEERDRLAVVVEAHANAFSVHEMDYKLTNALTHEMDYGLTNTLTHEIYNVPNAAKSGRAGMRKVTYNNTVHPTTGFSSVFLMFGRKRFLTDMFLEHREEEPESWTPQTWEG